MANSHDSPFLAHGIVGANVGSGVGDGVGSSVGDGVGSEVGGAVVGERVGEEVTSPSHAGFLPLGQVRPSQHSTFLHGSPDAAH